MKTVKMCPKCNADHIEAFEAALKDKEGIKFAKGCIGKCNVATPTCKVGKEVFQADTVDALAALV